MMNASNLSKSNDSCETCKSNLDASTFYQSDILPKGHSYQTVALVLQGGGALGSYQPGVYEGLAQANLHPNWVAGISIGALNAAIIAGNPPEKRVDQLKAFWETICQPPFFPASLLSPLDNRSWPVIWQRAAADWEAWRAMTEGQNGFFLPRMPSLSWFYPDSKSKEPISFYDTTPLKHTLESFVDFDRLNDPKHLRVSVGAVNVRTGNLVYFDNTIHDLRAEHFIASGALPPGFAAVEIDGEFYWDGGLVSNTPLHYVLTNEPRQNTLVFQVDLWSAKGEMPTDLASVHVRQKDIQYSSRTRAITSMMQNEQDHRAFLQQLMTLIPESEQNHPAYKKAKNLACGRLMNVIHLIYQQMDFETHHKDYQFGAQTMRLHWESGYQDIQKSLNKPDWLNMPNPHKPFITHDIHRLS